MVRGFMGEEVDAFTRYNRKKHTRSAGNKNYNVTFCFLGVTAIPSEIVVRHTSYHIEHIYAHSTTFDHSVRFQHGDVPPSAIIFDYC